MPAEEAGILFQGDIRMADKPDNPPDIPPTPPTPGKTQPIPPEMPPT
jgi:hypothetical protein